MSCRACSSLRRACSSLRQACSYSLASACRALGLNRSTVYARQKEPLSEEKRAANRSRKEVVALYKNHGTHEQFHSEFKTDLDLERLPSKYFKTNDLVMTLADE